MILIEKLLLKTSFLQKMKKFLTLPINQIDKSSKKIPDASFSDINLYLDIKTNWNFIKVAWCGSRWSFHFSGLIAFYCCLGFHLQKCTKWTIFKSLFSLFFNRSRVMARVISPFAGSLCFRKCQKSHHKSNLLEINVFVAAVWTGLVRRTRNLLEWRKQIFPLHFRIKVFF